MRRISHFLVILVLLLTGPISAEHSHEDHSLHIDCSLCVLLYSPVYDQGEGVNIKVSLAISKLEILKDHQEPSYRPTFKSIHRRAPPVA
ncbi:MAG: hypothetical protein ACK4OF_05735 [Aquificaceae bacterium]